MYVPYGCATVALLSSQAALVTFNCLPRQQCITSGATGQPVTQPVAPLCNQTPVVQQGKLSIRTEQIYTVHMYFMIIMDGERNHSMGNPDGRGSPTV